MLGRPFGLTCINDQSSNEIWLQTSAHPMKMHDTTSACVDIPFLCRIFLTNADNYVLLGNDDRRKRPPLRREKMTRQNGKYQDQSEFGESVQRLGGCLAPPPSPS